jgi:hypothetical protein
MIPKALLGADMDGSGLSNGGSLTEMNTTYARRIKRGQVAIQSALKTLINISALSDGLGDKIVNNFSVKLTPIITVEDNRRDELMQTKIRNINDIMNLFSNMESIDDETRLNMLIEWLSKYLNQQDIVDIINERLKELEQEEKENPDSEEATDEEDNSSSSFDLGPSGGMGRPSGVSKLAGNDTSEEPEGTSSETDNITPNPMTDENRPQLAPQVDLADISA